MKHISLSIIVLYIFTMTLLAASAFAADINGEISNNGAGSTNTIDINGSVTPTDSPTGEITPTSDVTIPNFTTCYNPQGTKIADNEGSAGIVGDFGSHEGFDAVYKVSDNTYTQCFCPFTGTDGMQTDWWNVSALSQSDIDSFTKDGWIFVANGADWGLDNAPFLAKNTAVNCSNGHCTTTNVTVTSTPTTEVTPSGGNVTETPTPTATPTPESSNGSSNENSSSGSTGNSTNNSTPVVNGVAVMAATGNEQQIALFSLMGLSSLLSGIVLRKFAK